MVKPLKNMYVMIIVLLQYQVMVSEPSILIQLFHLLYIVVINIVKTFLVNLLIDKIIYVKRVVLIKIELQHWAIHNIFVKNRIQHIVQNKLLYQPQHTNVINNVQKISHMIQIIFVQINVIRKNNLFWVEQVKYVLLIVEERNIMKILIKDFYV